LQVRRIHLFYCPAGGFTELMINGDIMSRQTDSSGETCSEHHLMPVNILRLYLQTGGMQRFLKARDIRNTRKPKSCLKKEASGRLQMMLLLDMGRNPNKISLELIKSICYN